MWHDFLPNLRLVLPRLKILLPLLSWIQTAVELTMSSLAGIVSGSLLLPLAARLMHAAFLHATSKKAEEPLA